MNMDASDWQFPLACPTCQALAGIPYRTTPDDQQLSIEVRCGQCLHEWTLSARSATLSLRRKPDRRHMRIT
jgi:hypothetical protein